ncbi:MAG: ankyrin repeat domain-containing protein [Rickettsiales bacterium]|jgi:ankyrin repeat protein|nr:ankyrin repeat domain-containing protein [Rickettsiales bacterium]
MAKGYILIVTNKNTPNIIKVVRTPARPEIRAEDLVGIKETNDISTIVYYAYFKNYDKIRTKIFKLLNKNKIKQRRKLFTLNKNMNLQSVIEVISKMNGRIFEKRLYKYVFENADIQELHKEEEQIIEDMNEEEAEDEVEEEVIYTDISVALKYLEYVVKNFDYDEYKVVNGIVKKVMEDDEEDVKEYLEGLYKDADEVEQKKIEEQKQQKEQEKNKSSPPLKKEEIIRRKEKKNNKSLYIILLLLLLLLLYFKACEKENVMKVIKIPEPEPIKIVEPLEPEPIVVAEEPEIYQFCEFNEAIKNHNNNILTKKIINIPQNHMLFIDNTPIRKSKMPDFIFNYDCETTNPLLTAIYYNNLYAINVLIQDTRFNYFGNYQTPLMTAIRLKATNNIITTIMNAYDIDERNVFNEIALMFLSVYNPNRELLTEFIEKNAKADIRDDIKNTALIYAIKYDVSTDFIKLLFNNSVAKDKNNIRKSLLLITAIKNNVNLDTIKFIVENGAKLNFVDKYGLKPFTYAIKNKEIKREIIDYLVDKKANVNNTNISDEGHNTITYAIKNGYDIKLIKKILNTKGFNITYFECSVEKNKERKCEKNPLVYVIKQKAGKQIANLLLKRGFKTDYTYYDRKLKKVVNIKELDEIMKTRYLK